ncbi:uncharacterized protein H6S33_010357 [Morchella sextelata]|uniref:uncharacterized protein n=1 Tax=Morchella sextelata TaxID=1174677 RepID=UPI001D049C26|nr:uncharacterized protein H6S33_010357 [Morchella sextelata]KAH0612305.1 hypothetical protein H6S33_010357 [Morchella sextelata]
MKPLYLASRHELTSRIVVRLKNIQLTIYPSTSTKNIVTAPHSISTSGSTYRGDWRFASALSLQTIGKEKAVHISLEIA